MFYDFPVRGFRLGFVHPLQDVALHQCLPLSPVCCFSVPGGSLLLCYVVLPSSAWSSPWSLPFPWLPLCASLCHLLSFLAIWPAHFHFCFSVYSKISIIFVLFLISEHVSYLEDDLLTWKQWNCLGYYLSGLTPCFSGPAKYFPTFIYPDVFGVFLVVVMLGVHVCLHMCTCKWRGETNDKYTVGLLNAFRLSFTQIFCCCFFWLVRLWVPVCLHIEGSRPEWCSSSMIYSRDTPFWSGTLDMHTYKWRGESNHKYRLLKFHDYYTSSCSEVRKDCVFHMF